MAELFSTATEFVANQLTFNRGDVTDVVSVHHYHSLDPNAVPAEEDFTEVTLEDGTGPLAEDGKTDVLSLIGPGAGSDEELETGGDWQRFVGIKTASEFIIRKVDVITVTAP